MSNNERLSAEQVSENYDKFVNMIKLTGDRSPPILDMIEHFNVRLATAPASYRTDFHNAFPGGLVEHSLRVLKFAGRLCKAYELDVPKESIIIAALLHDLGKVGDLDSDMYLPQDSDWHRERGMVYKINDSLRYMPHSDRALFFCQHFGVTLTQDEWIAIRTHDGSEADENRPYSMKLPMLAVIVQQADNMAANVEKQLWATQRKSNA